MTDPYVEAQKRIDAERREIVQLIREAGLEKQVLKLLNGWSPFHEQKTLDIR